MERRPLVLVAGVKSELPADDTLTGGVASGYIELTASTTWSKPTEATWVYVDIIAGGGSGGTNTSSTAQGAAGGECVSKLLRASDLPASISVVVGAGGAAKLGSSSVNGADGGSSSFNGLTAYGGRGGLTGSLSLSTNLRDVINVSVSADSLTKVILMPNGGYSQCSTVHGGAGGGVGSSAALSYPGKSIHHGNGGNGYGTADDAATATAGGFPGGGGGGRGYTSSVSTRTSGAGGAGVVRIWYW